MRLLPACLVILLGMPMVCTAAGCGDQSAVSAGKRLANTLRWTTASEVDNFAYDIYRATAKDGPFKKINADPVPGAGTTDETNHYSYRDDSIDPCKAYWYYVESISLQGRREKFTPVFKAPPKRKADAQGS